MHEIGVAQERLDKARAEAANHGASRVTSIQIKLGRASGIEAEHLQLCLEVLTRDTAAASARIEIEEIEDSHIYLCGLEVE
ncbi:MAG: hydrogenase maturation nickel metallochaperone HypA [Chloroflexi bacterium]|nr:hydrogenase maturation nickel metallochaperone HypA [Chloroflexota bacterium]